MPGQIFINYRREDAAQAAGRIYDRLAQAFSRDAVFMDIDKIPFGDDFTAHIRSQFDTCGIVLALIGPKWLSVTRGSWPFSKPRLHDALDWVRTELELALSKSTPILPVLVDGAVMPLSRQLPVSIRSLADRNAIRLRHESFSGDAEVLISSIRNALGETAVGSDRATSNSGAASWITERRESKGQITQVSFDLTDEQRRSHEIIDCGRLGLSEHKHILVQRSAYPCLGALLDELYVNFLHPLFSPHSYGEEWALVVEPHVLLLPPSIVAKPLEDPLAVIQWSRKAPFPEFRGRRLSMVRLDSKWRSTAFVLRAADSGSLAVCCDDPKYLYLLRRRGEITIHPIDDLAAHTGRNLGVFRDWIGANFGGKLLVQRSPEWSPRR